VKAAGNGFLDVFEAVTIDFLVKTYRARVPAAQSRLAVVVALLVPLLLNPGMAVDRPSASPDLTALAQQRSSDSQTRPHTTGVVQTAMLGMASVASEGASSHRHSDVVDIRDNQTGQWTRAQLSEPRSEIQATVVGTTVLFAGGRSAAGASARVDTYDSANGSSGYADLAEAWTGNAHPAIVGNQALFASRGSVDIYDATQHRWTRAALSVPREMPTVVVIGTWVIFAGGITGGNQLSPAIDMYDATNGQWTHSTLSEARVGAAGVVVGGKAIIAGGRFERDIGTSRTSQAVDTFTAATGAWSATTLPANIGVSPQPVLVADRLYFLSGRTIVAYDDAHGDWRVIPVEWPAQYGDPTQLYALLDQLVVARLSAPIHMSVLAVASGVWNEVPIMLRQGVQYPVYLPNSIDDGFLLGRTVILAGGMYFDRLVPIKRQWAAAYNLDTGKWQFAEVPFGIERPTAAVVGNRLVFFNRATVDVYDAETGTWKSIALSQAHGYPYTYAVAILQTWIIVAGGRPGEAYEGGPFAATVDVIDLATGALTTEALSTPRAGLVGAAVGEQSVFAGGHEPDG
jgi:hypothetical protein